MPIEKIHDKNISGITSDYINIFRDKINVNFNQIEIKSTDEGFNKLSTKKCDLVTFVKKLENTNNLFNFSNSHLSFPLVLFPYLPYISFSS